MLISQLKNLFILKEFTSKKKSWQKVPLPSAANQLIKINICILGKVDSEFGSFKFKQT